MAPPISNPYVVLDIQRLAYEDYVVLEDFTLTLERGQRVAICGKNGSGKSTLIKAILKHYDRSYDFESLKIEGSIRCVSGLIVSYVSQDTAFLMGTFENFAKMQGVEMHLLRSMLDKLDFEPILFDQDLSCLSEGQKKKVLLAASICQRAHLYIWDEPLNYIDLLSRLQIEEMILKYEPTVLFIEHDPHFVDRIASHMIELS